MKAAVVDSFDRPPRYREFTRPEAQAGEVLINVRAAALSQLVRAQASGKHYSSGLPPLVPGADGVGVLQTGERVYFAFPRGPVGSMAEWVAVNADNVVPLPEGLDDITAAAIANPGMSSWAALVERVFLQPGETVLVNGANGASGRLAIQIARHLGAGKVIAVARKAECESELRALGADAFLRLTGDREALISSYREHIAQGVDVVLDYLWGAPAEDFFAAATGHGSRSAAPRIRFVNMGSLAGGSVAMNASALRSSGIELTGCGLGSLSHAALIKSIGNLMQVVELAGLKIDAREIPLSEVETAWNAPGDSRIVFTL